MSTGLGGAIVGTVVVIAFVAVVLMLAHYSNQSAKSEAIHTVFCSDIKKAIDESIKQARLTNVTEEYIVTYSENCSH